MCQRFIQLVRFPVLSVLMAASGLTAHGAQSLVERAFAKTKTADSVADYSEIIQMCDQAAAGDSNAEDQAYAKRLASWALNRRGEARTEQAAAALERGDQAQANELDAQALADFEAAVQKDPKRWKALHNRGVSYAVAHRYQEAIADFNRVLELDDSYVNTWFNRGEIHYELGQLSEALRDYSQAIQLNPRDAGAYTSRGHAYFRLGRFRDALSDYNRAVQLAPSSADSYAARGDAYQSLGMWELAASDFRRATDLDPQSARAYQSAAWLMATCPDARFRNSELAVQAADRAVSLIERPDHRFLDTLAAARANAGQFDQAKTALSKAIELAPANEVEALKKRLELYNSQRPYRQDRSPSATTTPGSGRQQNN